MPRLQYNLISEMQSKSQSKRMWTAQEDRILTKVVKAQGKKNWKQISQQFNALWKSKVQRTETMCRERWNKHLNSKCSKEKITKQQLFFIYKSQQEYGNKWRIIKQKIYEKFNDDKDDSDIKNQFNNSMRKAFRFILKQLGFKNSTMLVKKLKLNDITEKLRGKILKMEEQDQIYRTMFQISVIEDDKAIKQKYDSQSFKDTTISFLKNLLEKISPQIFNQKIRVQAPQKTARADLQSDTHQNLTSRRRAFEQKQHSSFQQQVNSLYGQNQIQNEFQDDQMSLLFQDSFIWFRKEYASEDQQDSYQNSLFESLSCGSWKDLCLGSSQTAEDRENSQSQFETQQLESRYFLVQQSKINKNYEQIKFFYQ